MPHQRFADEDRLRAAMGQARDVFARVYPAFGNQEAFIEVQFRREPFSRGEIDFESF